MAKTAKTTLDPSVENTPKPQCFVIMPFIGWFNSYYSEIYKPAIEAAGFEAKRADDLYRPGNIVHDIWKYTRDAKVILADLTGKNPNVFYELGLAHAITKPAILVTSNMEDVPFDLRSLRVIVYDKDSPKWSDILSEKITKSLKETLRNPREAIPPTFLDTPEVNRIRVSSHEKDILELRKQMDSLKREIRSNTIAPGDMSKTRDEIEPEDAERIIEYYVENRMEEAEIVKRLKPLGPPTTWILHKIKEIKDNIKDVPIF